MDEIKGIRIVSLTGEKEYGIEDSEARQDVQQIVEGAPEAFDTFKEIAKYIAEDGATAAEIIKNVAANAQGIADEITRAKAAEKELDKKIDEEASRATAAVAAEKARAEQAEAGLDEKITEEKERAEKHLADEIDKIKDGDIIVGQAREIHSRNGKTVTDSFLIRTTAGSGTIGDGVASLKSVGGNIVKNLAGDYRTVNNNVVNTDGNGIKTILPSDSGRISMYYKGLESVTTIKDHIYYNACVAQSEEPDKLCFGAANGGFGYIAVQSVVSKTTAWQRLSYIRKSSTSTAIYHQVLGVIGTTSSPLYVKDFLVIDLTEMFGAGNEPDQATCDRLFGTMDALPQGLTIANPTEFKSTGFNQFNPDNVLEGKAITNNAIGSGDKKIAVIPCLPCKVGVGENNGYCIHGDFGDNIKVYLTPLNPKDVDGELYMHELTKDATTDTYVPQIKGYMLVEVPTTANLCAHFLWSEDKCERDTYEPYHESKVELPDIPQMSEWGLAGISNYYDTINLEGNKYNRKIEKIVLDGSQNWNFRANNTGYYNNDILKGREAYQNLILTDAKINLVAQVVTSNYGTISVGGSAIYLNYNEEINALGVAAFKDWLRENPITIYYVLATPEEYPLPKVDNNYISSDYGVEQFDSVVPCNANNLYYMRSLAGETRNFLDRMYDNTAKTDAKEVADYITNGIEGNKELATNAPNLALRALFVAAGAEYNDTNQVIYKNAPWGSRVEHLPKHWYLNGLGDITNEQMMEIYNESWNYGAAFANVFSGTKIRTAIYKANYSSSVQPLRYTFYQSKVETVVLRGNFVGDMEGAFSLCQKLKYIYPELNIGYQNAAANIKAFANNDSLIYISLRGLKYNLSLSSSPLIDKYCIVNTIRLATPTSAITITLHADAYARLAEDADIVAALAAQPLVTLVSA